MLIFLVIVTFFFFFNDTATPEIYTSIDTLSLHDALPISRPPSPPDQGPPTGDVLAAQNAIEALRSEEHTSELQSPIDISYAVFCLKKKKQKKKTKKLSNSY